MVALHAPLACIDDAESGPLAQWLAKKTGLPLVSDVGYPTPGSFGTWGGEQGIRVVTYEFPLTDNDACGAGPCAGAGGTLAGDAPWF